MNEFFKNTFKWKWIDVVQVVGGVFIASFAINTFIVPNHLYNGGVLGISQLIRSFLETIFDLPFDVSGLIYFLINIPLLFMAYKLVSRTFFYRTIVVVVLHTLFLSIIPVIDIAIVHEMLTSVLIGAILAGIGWGMVLSSGGSGGGTDIIGFVVSMRYKTLSVGKISRGINCVIYAVCGILYGVPTMVYSIIYSFISSIVVDHRHKQNICSSVMIFTKEEPTKLISFIKKELHRDCTYWEANGGFDDSKTYISYSAMSKYEMQRLERHLNELSPTAFLVKSEGVGIDGNFKKQLTD
jgi:uncharacterized membrane-anchored protein YitT (DUF2179 family)